MTSKRLTPLKDEPVTQLDELQELLAANIEAPEPADDVKALTEERDSLKADLEESEKKYNDLRERYVDAFFSTAAKGRDDEAAPKQPAKEPGSREGATLASLFGKE